jgi:hypothetical protein
MVAWFWLYMCSKGGLLDIVKLIANTYTTCNKQNGNSEELVFLVLEMPSKV